MTGTTMTASAMHIITITVLITIHTTHGIITITRIARAKQIIFIQIQKLSLQNLLPNHIISAWPDIQTITTITQTQIQKGFTTTAIPIITIQTDLGKPSEPSSTEVIIIVVHQEVVLPAEAIIHPAVLPVVLPAVHHPEAQVEVAEAV